MSVSPRHAIERLDRFSRRWPLSAGFGVFTFVGARALIGGHAVAAVFFWVLAVLFAGALVWTLRVSEGTGAPSDDRRP